MKSPFVQKLTRISLLPILISMTSVATADAQQGPAIAHDFESRKNSLLSELYTHRVCDFNSHVGCLDFSSAELSKLLEGFPVADNCLDISLEFNKENRYWEIVRQVQQRARFGHGKKCRSK